MKPRLIIISGFSCTGKSTLAKKIAQHYSLPVFGRDDFKEALFDSLGYCDRQLSKEFGIASYKLLYLTTEKILAAGNSLVIESNFQVNPDTEKLKNIKDKYQCSLIQIHCQVPMSLALARFKARSESGERHPGHVDHLILEEMKANLQRGGYKIEDICDRTIDLDTTEFNNIDYQIIYSLLNN